MVIVEYRLRLHYLPVRLGWISKLAYFHVAQRFKFRLISPLWEWLSLRKQMTTAADVKPDWENEAARGRGYKGKGMGLIKINIHDLWIYIKKRCEKTLFGYLLYLVAYVYSDTLMCRCIHIRGQHSESHLLPACNLQPSWERQSQSNHGKTELGQLDEASHRPIWPSSHFVTQ